MPHPSVAAEERACCFCSAGEKLGCMACSFMRGVSAGAGAAPVEMAIRERSEGNELALSRC